MTEENNSLIHEIQELRKAVAEIKGMISKSAVEVVPPPQATLQVRTAAHLYGIKVEYLRVLCTRGTVKSVMVGGRHYIQPEEMDRVFKGVVPTPGVNKARPRKK